MDTTAYVGEVISSIVYLVVGVRLYQLSRRTRQLPETLIATSFLLWAFCYAVWDIPYAFVESEEMIPTVYSVGSLIALASGNSMFAGFIRVVFRRNDRWAVWLVAAIAAANFGGMAGMFHLGDWDGTNPLANPWYWIEGFGSFAPTTWMGVEGFIQYFKKRRQLKLGFCEPMACHRFLLWGIAGSLWVILEAIITASDLVYAFTGRWSEGLGFGIGLLELVPIAIVWIVFFPPAFYSRWVERASSVEVENRPLAS